MTEPQVPTPSAGNTASEPEVRALKAGQWVATHRKLVVFAVTAAAVMATQLWGTDNVYVQLVLLVLGGLGVHQVPNARK
jgi:hypothetical protein